MFDLHKVGGTPALMRALLDAGMLHGDCPTVTGGTIAENLEGVPSIYSRPQVVVKPLDAPLYGSGHIKILRGNVAPEGAVVKTAGLKKRSITGPAKVYDGEEACFAAVEKREIKPGDVVVIRGEGPVGGPGMREMLSVTAALVGQGLGDQIGLITDGTLLRRYPRPGRRPYRARSLGGGPIALLQDGDIITIDAKAKASA